MINIFAELEKERTKNKQIERERKHEVYSKIPKIKEIDDNLALTLIKLTKEIILKSNKLSEGFEDIKRENLEYQRKKKELLIQNNYPKDYLEPLYTCKKCMDKGFILHERCECFKVRLIARAYENSNLAGLLYKQNFKKFNFDYYSKIPKGKNESPYDNMVRNYNLCLKFVNEFEVSSNNLLLYGDTGLGKTFLSTSIAKEILDKGIQIFYQSAGRIFEIFEEHKFGNVPNRSKINYIYEVALLIIDDLGSELTTKYTEAVLFEIINTRILTGKSTVINTNCNFNKLSELYSDRVVSRIIESYTHLRFFGEDIRKIKFKLKKSGNLAETQ